MTTTKNKQAKVITKKVKRKKEIKKFTEERKEIILNAIQNGLSQRDAAKLAGIHEITLTRWKKKDDKFASLMEQKEIRFKRANIAIIQKASLDGSWQASAWLLERKFKDEFATKEYHENKIQIETPISKLSDEELENRTRKLLQGESKEKSKK